MRKVKAEVWIVVAFFALFGGLLAFDIGIAFCTEDTVIATVQEKERVVTGGGETISSKYLIYTSSEVLENTDCLVRGKFNSSDMYSKLKPGSEYEFTVIGWRLPFFSSYRNIIEAREIQ